MICVFFLRQGKGKRNYSRCVQIEEAEFTNAYAHGNMLADSTHDFRADLQDRLPE